ncbi:unnamed protein product [Ciceribacter sp. T2.26MG-112.2]|nr:unnamed protein product [Ciceribacter naphthalenivorans]
MLAHGRPNSPKFRDLIRGAVPCGYPAAERSSKDPATADKGKKKRVWHRRDKAGRRAVSLQGRKHGRAETGHGEKR